MLESRGLTVCQGRWMSSNKVNPTKEFGYEVSDGRFTVVITGGTLPDGVIGYRVVPFVERSFKFWLWSKKEEYRIRVQEMLREGGGQLWVDYPYD
jgi:hypothetical protein